MDGGIRAHSDGSTQDGRIKADMGVFSRLRRAEDDGLFPAWEQRTVLLVRKSRNLLLRHGIDVAQSVSLFIAASISTE
jgi:hypothetical protein